ncbi:MAG: T9SS type A sorting domain-containing protein [Candidatus Marinimicrobia bacterium]|nr:T9SS type A sorting domain-containing protein [Candidatus Neomarinimicrobiota bacterium]
MKRQNLLVIALTIFTTLWCQLSITNVDGVAQYVIDFDTTVPSVNNGQFDGTFPYPNPQTGDLDADAWTIKRSVTLEADSTYYMGTNQGGVSGLGVYGFDIGTSDFAFGLQPGTSKFCPGSIALEIINNLPDNATVTHITLSYEIWTYNDKNRSTVLTFSHSYTNVNGDYISIPSLDFATPTTADDVPSWALTSKGIWIEGLNIPNGSSYFLRWDTDDGIGSSTRDQIALDDITISAGNALDIDDFYLPNGFGLLDAYPNPFNPSTNIQYKLNEMGNTVIRLFNLNGELLQELSNTVQTTGQHSIRFDGSQFPSGVYLIELESKNYRDTQIITLLK